MPFAFFISSMQAILVLQPTFLNLIKQLVLCKGTQILCRDNIWVFFSNLKHKKYF